MHRVISGMMQVAALSSSQSTIVLGPGCPLVDHGSGLEEFSNEATSGPTRLQKERKNRVNGPTRTSDRIGTFFFPFGSRLVCLGTRVRAMYGLLLQLPFPDLSGSGSYPGNSESSSAAVAVLG